MADIKTKDNAKGTIRTIDKAAVATQRMKQAYIATKEKAERSVNANSSSAEEYASDKLEGLCTLARFGCHQLIQLRILRELICKRHKRTADLNQSVS